LYNEKAERGRNPVEKATDNDLMIQVRDGKIEKMAVLFERHHVMLYNFFLRLTGNRSISEDLVQDVFVRMLKYRSTYQGQDKFMFWVFRIARNAHIDFLRKKKDEISIDDHWYEAPSSDPLPSEKTEKAQDVIRLNQALAKLPVKKREVLLLSRFQNMKQKEIAELMGCRTGAVKAMIHRAVKDLGKAYLELSGGVAS
jgi:RNA polymerase sigma-70 factor (ECF subfamily)